MRLTVLAATLVLLAGCGNEPVAQAVAAVPTQKPEMKTFRDWWDACGAFNTCSAYAQAVDYGVGWIRVGREAGPDGKAIIAAGFAPDTREGELALIVDGVRWPLSDGDGGCPDCALPDTDWGEYSGDGDALARAIAQAREIRVAHGKESQALNASGAAAALLWIDERQGRIGTTTAWLRRGDRSANTVPAALPAPVVTAAPAEQQTGFDPETRVTPAPVKRLAEACRASEDTGDEGESRLPSPEGARLNASTELWGVACGEGGYFSLLHDWYLTGPNGVNPRPLALPSADGTQLDQTTNGAYDPATRTLSMFEKGRGIGDCGIIRSWVWTGERFELSEEIVSDLCAGVPWDHWAALWQADVRR
ncbi:DUF1176 domain-containing protein [Brevundimonas sp. FT23028]|uniref:DUF1176 domain-containing protein n=1 Tax=Brevundimonas sp. FT23028 TaxID=3393748 RepID=UPI003B587D33